MPSADMTVPVLFWPLRTCAELDAAGWEIYDAVSGVTAHTMRSYGEGTAPDVFLQVVAGWVGVVADPRLGQVLVMSGGAWESISVEEAEARGLPMPPTPEP